MKDGANVVINYPYFASFDRMIVDLSSDLQGSSRGYVVDIHGKRQN